MHAHDLDADRALREEVRALNRRIELQIRANF